MFDQARDRRRINRMMSELPIRQVKAKSAPSPFPPLKVYPYREAPSDRLNDLLLIVLAVLVAVLTILCAIGGSLAEEQPTPMYVTVSSGSWLNGRLKPDTGSSVEARFYTGDEVDVYEVSGRWAKVAGGECGFVWCDIRYLSANAPDTQPETRTVQADGRVRVRKTPDGSTVKWLHSGDTVKVQFTIDGWAYTGDGYVLEKYLETQESGSTLPGEPAPES